MGYAITITTTLTLAGFIALSDRETRTFGKFALSLAALLWACVAASWMATQ